MREKRATTNVIAYFCDALDGKHEPRQTSWLVFRNSTGASHFMGPPRLPPSLDPPSSEAKPPTSLWKGEGWLGCILACEGAVAVEAEPTSLNRGEGLVTGSPGEVVGGVGASEGGGRGGGGRTRVEFNR